MHKVMYFLIIALLVGVSVTAGMDWGPFGNSTTSSSNSDGNHTAAVTTSVNNFDGQYPVVDEVVGIGLDSEALVEKVAPAVVSIVTETVSYNWGYQAIPQTSAG